MLKKKTIIIMAFIITTILLCTSITSATDNTTTTPEKISKTNTHTTPTTTTNTQQDTTKKEVKKINKENKTIKKDSYAVTVNSKTITPGTTTLTATVKNNNYYSSVNSGTVFFYVDYILVASSTPNYGTATAKYTFDKEGTHNYFAEYYNYGSSYYSNYAKIKVEKNSPEIVKLDMPSKTTTDTTIKIVARVTKDGKRANVGKLKITANWKTIYENPNIQQGLGAVYYKTPSNPGTYTIVAQFLKNGKLITQDKKTITIPRPQIKLSMPTESETDKNIKIISRVTQDNKNVNIGQIKILANGKTIYNKKNNQGIGAVYYKTPGKAGTYTITTQYINNGKTISQDTQTLKIINTEKINLEISGSYSPNKKITLTAYVSKASGTVNNGNVRFKIDGTTIGTNAVKNGMAVMTYTLPNYETYLTCTAEYIKNGEIISSSSKNIEVEEHIVYYSSYARSKQPYIENPYYNGAQTICSTIKINGYYYHLGCGGILLDNGYERGLYSINSYTKSSKCYECGHVFSENKHDYTEFL